MEATVSGTTPKPKLKRVLGLWDPVYYGVILTSPIAVVPMFGEAQVLSHGHAVITLLAAMVAMTATAVSFGATSATSYTVNSDTQITAISPAGAADCIRAARLAACPTGVYSV